MEGMFAGRTDPVPYIAAAYAIGVVLIVLTPVFIHQQYAKLTKILADSDQPRKG